MDKGKGVEQSEDDMGKFGEGDKPGEEGSPGATGPVEEDELDVVNPTPAPSGDDESLIKQPPAQCHSDEDKIGFLRSTSYPDYDTYQAVVDILAQMRVSFHFTSVIYIWLITKCIKVSDDSTTVNYPGKCFSWDWGNLYADRAFHTEKGKKKLSRWLATDPHLLESGDLASRAALMQVWLGVGILLEDVHLILSKEDHNPDELPDYIMASPLSSSECEMLQAYVNRVYGDIVKSVELSRYVIWLI